MTRAHGEAIDREPGKLKDIFDASLVRGIADGIATVADALHRPLS